MGIIELTVTSCLHLVRMNSQTLAHEALASGVIVKYRERFFICTVAHFTDYDDRSIGIVTGRKKDNETEVYVLGDFSYMTIFTFEDEPDAEDLEYVLSNPEKGGDRLDIAFKEISLLDNIIQKKKVFNLGGIGDIVVHEGGKSMIIVDDNCQIDEKQQCSFFGRIRSDYVDGILNFHEMLYWGLPIKSVSEHFIEMDLGEPVRDSKRFKGCSGAPIIDTCGKLIGVVTHGFKDLNKSSIFGFRFDKVKQWIDLMYFQIS